MENINTKNFIVQKVGQGIVHLQINRSSTFNSFDEETWIEYEAILLELDTIDEVNVIIISGIGHTFSSGLNLKFITSKFKQLKNDTDFLRFLEAFQRCVSAPLKIKKPTIGVIHGSKNFGLAVDLLCCFTVRIFTKDVTFSLKEIQLGLVPDMGVLERLARQTSNISLLSRLSLTGEVFGIEEVLELGLVSKKDISEDYKSGLERAILLGKSISKYEGWCVKGVKRSIEEIIEDDCKVDVGLKNVLMLNVNNFKAKSTFMGPVKHKL